MNSEKQLSTTWYNSLQISPWIVLIISCTIITLTIIILITTLCFCNCFPRRRRSKQRAYITSDDANIYSRNHRTSSVSSRLLSFDAFDASDQIINMAPLECGVIRRSNFYENEVENIRIMKQYYSRVCHWFTMRELIEATNNFHSRNLIGVGCYGKVYRGFLLDGTRVAVKDLSFTSGQTEQFRRIVEAIPNMTHKNLVKVVGFCVEEWDLGTRYILVSEYVDNGNLYQLLHANDAASISYLTWRTRMDIISGIAKGLAYLHEDVGQKIVHTHLQSHKILMDRQWNPKISDFAVPRLLNHTNFCSHVEMNEKEDVYSFGILVMEVISGRKPIENKRFREEQQLVTWLKFMVLNKSYEQVVDSKIPELPPLKELKRVLLIALRCADPDTKSRPKMGEVIHMLEPRDLLLSDGQDVYRRSFSQDSQVFSDQLLIEFHVSDHDL